MLDALDGYDRKILSLLARNGRLSWRDLADAISLSLTPTIRRVRRLEEQGYIEGYGALLSERRLAGSVSVFVSVELEKQTSGALRGFDDAIGQMPEVMECYMMTGDADYLLRIVVRDVEQYEAVVSRLAQVPGISHIKSSFAVRPVLRRTTPTLQDWRKEQYT